MRVEVGRPDKHLPGEAKQNLGVVSKEVPALEIILIGLDVRGLVLADCLLLLW